MKSCLYEVKIVHERREPKQYRFEHTVFMFYLDLDELDVLARKTWLFGHNQGRPYDFRESDHIGDVRTFLGKHGISDVVKNIRLLTNVRTFGHIFNPVSFYFCFSGDDRPVCTVVEIGNTFGELKYFFLGPEKRSEKSFKDRQVKYYYISPFTDLDNILDFDIQVPDAGLKIGIDVIKDERRFFYSSMLGRQRSFTTANLLWHTVRFPFITLKVIFLIHWHAVVLHFIKKVKYHPKEEDPEMQRDLERPWVKR